MDTILNKFWEIENTPLSQPFLSPEDALVENIFRETTVRLPNGAFQVDLPLKTSLENNSLGDSHFLAKKRFLNLEKRFERHPQLYNDYKKFIDEYISLGHAQIIPMSLQTENNENKYFLPHHCVIKEASKSTKLRVVFDGSMKTTSGLSLNDIMYKGYTVQPELFEILLRFRSFKFVITSDIEKMYRQVRINPSQTHLQNILWRDNPSEPIKCLELLTVTYGTSSASWLATRALKELALTHQDEYPLASKAIISQTYVDDALCGEDSLENLQKLYQELIDLCKLGNLSLHKWCSNSSEFLQENNLISSPSVYQENVDISVEGISNKVLGLFWNPNSDNFSISIPEVQSQSSVTKRQVLSLIAQMFDPLGLIGPIIVIAKIIMQEIWKSKINWDEELSEQLFSQWTMFYQNISSLNTLKIPRFVLSDSTAIHVELHGFSDASRLAYGACIYVRALYPNGSVTCHLITSKSRIAPIKELSIPRMELCAAHLLSNLTAKVTATLNERIEFQSINLWTDSEIVLAWLNAHPSRFNVFIANRISQIQTTTPNAKWRHIPTKENPADHLSRGLTPDQIKISTLWWHGPNFLQNYNLNLNNFKNDIKETHLEERKTQTILISSAKDSWSSFFERFSNYNRLQRSVAYVFRFINNAKPNTPNSTGPLSVEELRNSEIFILKTIQAQSFSKELREIKSPNLSISNKHILQLNPFIDENDLIRVGGRLSHADIPLEQKFPILLPSHNHVVKLRLLKEHIRLEHAGPQTVLSNIRLQYWPLNGLKEIKKISYNCAICYKFKAKNCQQIMSDLPKDRVVPSRPFSKAAVDFGGPFFVKSSTLRNSKVEKAYIAVFVCMVTKAVHLELVSSLSTPAFLACFKRFISRRGCPSKMYSDNGTNFLGASNQIKELYDFLNKPQSQEQIINFCSSKEIEWNFIPPHSPHWGGLWEAAVKSTKYHLKRLIGEERFTFEEFSTILCQIEAILNSRPLVPISSDSSDLTCLTPGHFLIGTSPTSYPESNISDVPMNRLQRWNRISQIQQNFWKRWSKDYLNQLQQRPKWFYSKPNLRLNDVVLLKEDNTKPYQWPLARVLELIPSEDGHVRLVKLKTQNGIFSRNITKLCPLPNIDN